MLNTFNELRGKQAAKLPADPSYEIWIEESQKRAARDWDWDSFDQEINGFVTCYLHPVGQGKG